MSRKKKTTDLSRAFGQAVKKLREDAGYRQEKFAYHADIDRGFFGLIERGQSVPTIATLWKIADGLGMKPQEVIAAVEKEKIKAGKEP